MLPFCDIPQQHVILNFNSSIFFVYNLCVLDIVYLLLSKQNYSTLNLSTEPPFLTVGIGAQTPVLSRP